MISQKSIMDAIQKKIAESLPAFQRIYQELVPQNFLRPSMLIEAVSFDIQEAGRTMVQVKSCFTLTLHASRDEYCAVTAEELICLQEQVIFCLSGALPVENRAICTVASSGGRDWDKAYVDLQLCYYDDRSDLPKEPALMQSIQTNIQRKG